MVQIFVIFTDRSTTAKIRNHENFDVAPCTLASAYPLYGIIYKQGGLLHSPPAAPDLFFFFFYHTCMYACMLQTATVS